MDILISDYSSIFFDFLITGRPIVFYVPDLKEYESGRGLYVPVNTLPGIVSSDLDEVASSLDAICKNRKEYCDFYKPQLDEMNRWCTYNDDGLSTQRLINIIFKDYTYLSSRNQDIIKLLMKGRKKFLYVLIQNKRAMPFGLNLSEA